MDLETTIKKLQQSGVSKESIIKETEKIFSTKEYKAKFDKAYQEKDKKPLSISDVATLATAVLADIHPTWTPYDMEQYYRYIKTNLTTIINKGFLTDFFNL